MLAYFLATIMAFKSLTLLLNAFISPKTHRQDDFLWSGLGLFYALILWLCAGRFTGAVLLGQVAGVAITIAFMWENQSLRKAITVESDSNEVLEGFSVLNSMGKLLAKVSNRQKTPVMKVPESAESQSIPEVPSTPTELTTEEKLPQSEQVTEDINEAEISSQSQTTPEKSVETSPQSQPVSEKIVEEVVTSAPIQPETIVGKGEELDSTTEETVDDSLGEDNQEQPAEVVNETIVEKVTVITEEIKVTTAAETPEEKTIAENIARTIKQDFDDEDFLVGSPSTEESIDSQPESKPNFFGRIINIFRKPKTKIQPTPSEEIQTREEEDISSPPDSTEKEDLVIITKVEEFSSKQDEPVSLEEDSQPNIEEEVEEVETLDLSDNLTNDDDTLWVESDSVDIPTTTVETNTIAEKIDTDAIEKEVEEEKVEEIQSVWEEDSIDKEEENPLIQSEATTEEELSLPTNEEIESSSNRENNTEELSSTLDEIEYSVEEETADRSLTEEEKNISQTTSLANEEDEVLIDGMEMTVEQNVESDSLSAQEEKDSPVEISSPTADDVPQQDIIESLNDLPSPVVVETSSELENDSLSVVTEKENDDINDDDIDSLTKLFEDDEDENNIK